MENARSAVPVADDSFVDLVLFDGVCALCDTTVRFLLRRDRRRRLAFAPLQGVTAKEVLARHDLPHDVETIVLVRHFGEVGESISVRSEAVLLALRELGGAWTALSWLRWVPRPVRDVLYGWVARHRYRWFGRFDVCRLPPPGTADRFLD